MLSRALTSAFRTKTLGARSLTTVIDSNEEDILREVMKTMPDKFKVAATDIDGVLRSKYISSEKFLSGLKSSVGFCSVIFGWDMNDKCYDNTKLVGGHTGYADVYAKFDLKTLRLLPWENNVPLVLMDFIDGDLNPYPICPRQLLKSTIKKGVDATGLSPLSGLEYEYYTFDETSQSLHDKQFNKPLPLTPGMFGYSAIRTGQNKDLFDQIFTQMKNAGVKLECLHTETGPGVFEAAIQYGDPLTVADSASIFKYGMKIIGHQHGVLPCFMAKPHANLPGCSGHVHTSLKDESGNNAFYDPGDEFYMSETFKHFVAGQLLLMPALMAMYCPTVNSYKRLVPGFWAPTIPSWGVENRISSVRVIPDGKKGTRLETRIPGADSNAYLALAASLASGYYGVINKISLDSYPMTVGSVVPDNPLAGKFPRNLLEAAENLHSSKIAREIFSDDFVDHFAATREWEWRQFQSAVTNWELERYMEIV